MIWFRILDVGIGHYIKELTGIYISALFAIFHHPYIVPWNTVFGLDSECFLLLGLVWWIFLSCRIISSHSLKSVHNFIFTSEAIIGDQDTKTSGNTHEKYGENYHAEEVFSLKMNSLWVLRADSIALKGLSTLFKWSTLDSLDQHLRTSNYVKHVQALNEEQGACHNI